MTLSDYKKYLIDTSLKSHAETFEKLNKYCNFSVKEIDGDKLEIISKRDYEGYSPEEEKCILAKKEIPLVVNAIRNPETKFDWEWSASYENGKIGLSGRFWEGYLHETYDLYIKTDESEGSVLLLRHNNKELEFGAWIESFVSEILKYCPADAQLLPPLKDNLILKDYLDQNCKKDMDYIEKSLSLEDKIFNLEECDIQIKEAKNDVLKIKISEYIPEGIDFPDIEKPELQSTELKIDETDVPYAYAFMYMLCMGNIYLEPRSYILSGHKQNIKISILNGNSPLRKFLCINSGNFGGKAAAYAGNEIKVPFVEWGENEVRVRFIERLINKLNEFFDKKYSGNYLDKTILDMDCFKKLRANIHGERSFMSNFFYK